MRIFIDGRDPFVIIAAEWNSVDIADVTSEHRKEMKKVTYSVLYGVGSASLAIELGITVSQAQDFIDEFRYDFFLSHS
jgi:DNA polymerase I-like protein with 3'-5' exonuclease and polymerase domains